MKKTCLPCVLAVVACGGLLAPFTRDAASANHAPMPYRRDQKP